MYLKCSIIGKAAAAASTAETTSKEQHWSQRKQPAEGQSERAGRGCRTAGSRGKSFPVALGFRSEQLGPSVINSLLLITLYNVAASNEMLSDF